MGRAPFARRHRSDWLVERRVALAGVETTGLFWKPVVCVLEEVIEDMRIINARHKRNVARTRPGVADALPNGLGMALQGSCTAPLAPPGSH